VTCWRLAGELVPQVATVQLQPWQRCIGAARLHPFTMQQGSVLLQHKMEGVRSQDLRECT
jgi:hypothetical protein